MLLPRVVFITTGLEEGGAEAALARLVTAPGISKWVAGVISLADEGKWGAELRDAGIMVESIGLRGGALPGLSTLRRLGECLSKLRPNIIQGWMYHGNYAALVARYLARTPQVKVVWSIRHALHAPETEKSMTQLLIRLGPIAERMTQIILFNSSAAAEQHIKYGYPAKKCLVIPNGIDVSSFTSSAEKRESMRRFFGIPDDATVVGTLARYHPTKDFETLARVAARVCQEEKGTGNVVFFLGGSRVDDSNQELVSHLKRLGITGRVILAGSVAKPVVVIPAFDISLMTSRSEAFPNFALESLSCGVPTVVTDVGDCAELVGNGGCVAPPGDVAGLASHLLNLIRDPELRQSMGRAGRARVEEHYSIELVARRYRELYESLLSS